MRGVLGLNGKAFLTDELIVRQPGAHEVRVRVLTSGICRSDLLPLDHPDPAPIALGHEAAGVVEEVGAAVTSVKVGQFVAVSGHRPCLRCTACARGRYSACPHSMVEVQWPFTWQGRPTRAMSRVSSLAEEIVVDELQIVPADGLEAAGAALVGCAVSTGYGTVRNVAGLAVGESIAVFGVGGIGINAIQTARLVGAARIIALDVNPDKKKVALRFGADRFVHLRHDATAEELVAQWRAEVGPPVDAVVECTGQLPVLESAPDLLDLGGRLALVGIPHDGVPAGYDVMNAMLRHITITGALNGGCDPFVDLPNIVQLARQGRLDLSGQVSHRWPLDRFDEAFAALRAGEVLRAVVDMSTTD